MIRISPSILESFRLYLDADFISTEEMESRIRREPVEPNHAMLLGKAFHACIEGDCEVLGDVDHYPAYRSGGYTFDAVSVDAVKHKSLPEVTGWIDLLIDGVTVRLYGIADAALGLVAREYKTSEKPIAPEKYADSMQWKCYVLIFGVKKVIYRNVLLKLDEVYRVEDWFDVTFYAYPNLRKDVEAMLRKLLDFARSRGILESLDVEAA